MKRSTMTAITQLKSVRFKKDVLALIPKDAPSFSELVNAALREYLTKPAD